MKINKDMYVRTKDGFIDKVTIDYEGYCNSPTCNCKHVSCEHNYYDEDEIVKASHNIIDLIENELIEILKEMDKKRVEELEPNSRKLFDSIMKIADERDKYKSLYQNEKDKNDTLKRIIKKIEEYIKNIDEEEFVNTEHYVEILDLLKEIK